MTEPDDFRAATKKMMREGAFENFDSLLLHFQFALRDAVIWEREECAKLAQASGNKNLADQIRARSVIASKQEAS